MSENRGQYLKNIKINQNVGITTRENRHSIISGVVTKILTNSEFHTHGIMVELIDGTIGRVKEIYDDNNITESTSISQNNHTNTSEKQPIYDELDVNREPKQTSISINDDDTGYSYENLFYPYLKNATEIIIEDAYIRAEHQIKNLGFFCSIIPENNNPISLHLITGPDDISKDEQIRKLDQLKDDLMELNITFSYEFDTTLHDRSIKLNNGWKIILGKGFDIFKKAGSYYSPANFDQTKKKCYKTEIHYLKIRI